MMSFKRDSAGYPSKAPPIPTRWTPPITAFLIVAGERRDRFAARDVVRAPEQRFSALVSLPRYRQPRLLRSRSSGLCPSRFCQHEQRAELCVRRVRRTVTDNCAADAVRICRIAKPLAQRPVACDVSRLRSRIGAMAQSRSHSRKRRDQSLCLC